MRGSRRSQRQIDREMKEEADRIQRENQAREAEEMSNSPRLELLFSFYINGQTSHNGYFMYSSVLNNRPGS